MSSDCAQRAACVEDSGTINDVARPPAPESSANPEAQADIANEQGVEVIPDARGDTAREAATEGPLDSALDSAIDAPVDTGVDATVDVGVDTGQDTGVDVGQEAAVVPGPRCLAGDGSFYFCNANEHCCVDGPTRAATCETSCASGTNPVDCPGATGSGGCGSQVCCGTLTFMGGALPNCTVMQLNSSCVDSCSATTTINNYPGSTACTGTWTLRYCTAAADCAMEPNGSTACCNFGTPASALNWCVVPGTIGWNYCL